MSLLNGLLYLMLMSAGLSTALILFDLKKREDRAYAKLEALNSSRQDIRSSQDITNAPGTVIDRQLHHPPVRRVVTKDPVRLTSFFDIDYRNDRSPSNQGTASLNYDFAMPNKTLVNKRTINPHADFNADTSCCA